MVSGDDVYDDINFRIKMRMVLRVTWVMWIVGSWLASSLGDKCHAIWHVVEVPWVKVTSWGRKRLLTVNQICGTDMIEVAHLRLPRDIEYGKGEHCWA
jgi:hypothetical protein